METLDVKNAEFLNVVGELLARSFAQATNWQCIFGVGGTKNLAWLLARYVELHDGHTYVRRDENGAITATCTIRPPTVRITTWSKIRVGLLQFPFYFGFGPRKQLEELTAFYKTPGKWPEGAYYVTSVAVREDMRGQGIGTTFLREALDNAVPNGAPVVLNTQSPANVRLYERLGFSVVSERKLPMKYPGMAVDTDYAMLRK